MRADGLAAFSEPCNLLRSTPVGATLASMRAAVEAPVADLVARNQFIEWPVRGRPEREILLSFGLEKGGHQSSCQAILACINQPQPCIRDNTILFGVFTCQKDEYSSLAAMAELYAQDFVDFRTNGVTVGGVTRAVHMTLTGEYSFTTTIDGHAGATCRFPCGYCCCMGRLSAANKKLLPNYENYGSIQDGVGSGRMPFTLEQKQAIPSL